MIAKRINLNKWKWNLSTEHSGYKGYFGSHRPEKACREQGTQLLCRVPIEASGSPKSYQVHHPRWQVRGRDGEETSVNRHSILTHFWSEPLPVDIQRFRNCPLWPGDGGWRHGNPPTPSSQHGQESAGACLPRRLYPPTEEPDAAGSTPGSPPLMLNPAST